MRCPAKHWPQQCPERETVWFWWDRFGPIFGRDLKGSVAKSSIWKWHLDEVFVKIKGETHYLWRAVDHEDTVLECYVSKRRDRRSALKMLKKLLLKYRTPSEIVTDKLKSYSAALREIGATCGHQTVQYQNNQCENSHLQFRRRECAMARLRSMGSLQKFTSIQSAFHNHFQHQRHLETRPRFKTLRDQALQDWREIGV